MHARVCPNCGVTFETSDPRTKSCSRKCANTLTSRKTAKKRGDVLRGRGQGKAYRKLNGRHEHRVIMETIIGRPLEPGEVVHHKDGNIQNNDPDNLELLASQGEHARQHSTKNRKCEVPGCSEKHFCKGRCRVHYRLYLKGVVNHVPRTKSQRG
jgi:hypothetical protein